MKRLFFICTIVLCSILGTSAQTLFYEGFDAGFLASDLGVVDLYPRNNGDIIITAYPEQPSDFDGIICVTPLGAGDHSGNGWANAVSSIAEAQLIAQSNNAVVWVAAGTYYGDTSSTSANAFTMVEGVDVYGGFAGNEPADYDLSLRDFEANATILDGQNARRVLNQPFGFNNRTEWDGFTIRNGRTSGSGAGVYMLRNSRLSSCKVQDNVSTSGYGGGVYAANASVEDCDIEGNTCYNNGGGVYASNSTVSECNISGNNTIYIGSICSGGGVYASSSTVTGCQITHNTSAYYGGGVYLYNSSTIRDCQIVHNTTNRYGGGVYTDYGGSILSCRISRNRSSYSGGGIYSSYSLLVRNCLVDNNSVVNTSSSYGGGGIYGSGTVVNTTIVRNTSTGDGAGVNGSSSTMLRNCIVWGNERNGTSNNLNGSSIVCSYSAVEGGYLGTGIVLLDNGANSPKFVTPSITAGLVDSTENVDWHLQQVSLCINRGNNSVVTDSLDLDGTARVKRDTVDMGCYESDYYSVPLTVYDSIIYVTVTGAGTHMGNSWANATSSIAEAQALAITHDAVVWVAAGTYYGDTTSTSENAFTMRDGVNVYGGFAGNEPAGYDLSLRDFEANATILDGQNARRVLNQPFEFNNRTEWDGFTIRNGRTSGSGAGVYMRRNSRLSNCKVQDNVSTSGSGGGVYAANASVEDCDIEGNTCYNNGGGVYASNSTVSDCRIESNATTYYYSSYGGGGVYASSSTVTGCQIMHNTANGSGGGVYLYSGSSTIRDCQIVHNTANRYGGGVYTDYGGSILSCRISRNLSSYSGGGIYSSSTQVRNCLVDNNTAGTSSSSYGGGGIYGSCTVVNTTIVRNTSTGDGAGVNGSSSTTLRNCIVWGNERNGNSNNLNGSSVVCSYSAVEGGYVGDSIIMLSAEDPLLFANPAQSAGANDSTANVDWRLQQGSPCINVGNNTFVTDSLDLDGTARIKRDTVDLGCYESDFYSPVPVETGVDTGLVEVTVGPLFKFCEINGTESIHSMEANQGEPSMFEMYLYDNSAFPAEPDDKVFIDFQIYKDGVPMSDAELADVMDNYASNSKMLYDFDLSVGAPNISYMTMQNAVSEANGFLPNSSDFGWTSYTYDWFYMHFFLGTENADHSHNGRKITVNTGIWKPGSSGVYTFSYAVIKAGIFATSVNVCYNGIKKLGGYGSYDGLTVKDTLATDFFTIYVGDSTGGGSDTNVVAGATLPSVTTGVVSNILATTATCGGNVTDDGGATVTARGVCWSTSQNPTVADIHTNDSTGTGVFASNLTNLIPNTIYYVRAYAMNSEGAAYGDEVVFTTLPDYSGIIYVTQTGAGTHTGDSWANAISSIDSAQVLAQEHSAVVWVAAGTYYGDTLSNNAFTMRDGVSVYGGFAGNEPSNYNLLLRDFETNATILDGMNSRRVLIQFIEFDEETSWDGFTIRNGRTPSAGPQPNNCGGGALIRNGNLRHCYLENNYSYTDGGGIYVYSSAEIQDCKVVNNYARVFGGGIYVVINNPVVISNCLVANNTGNYGICSWYNNSSMHVINTTIVNNETGGVYSSNGPSYYENCLVWGNGSSLSGSVNCMYSAIQGGYSGEGNINLSNQNTGDGIHPFFVNPTQGRGTSYSGGDWHLLTQSACINAGSLDSTLLTETDLDGNPRVNQGRVDMGCYELQYDLIDSIVSVIVIPNDAVFGTVTGSGTYTIGDTVTLNANPNQHVRFLRWSDNDTTNPRVVIAERDTMFTAVFEYYLPELHVTSISHSDFIGGESVTISWTVQNDGTAPTPNGEVWYDRVWLSVENRVAANDNNPILLGEYPNISALAPGEYYTQSQTVTIPLSISGSYFLFVIADAYDAHHIYWDSIVPIPYNPPVYLGANSNHCSGENCGNVAGDKILEISEMGVHPYYHDNFFYELVDITMPALPDLEVTFVFPYVQNFYSGSVVNLTYQVLNDGDYDTRVTDWYDVIFISYHDQFDETAQRLKVIPRTNAVVVPDPDSGFGSDPDHPSAPAQRGVHYRGVLMPDSSYQVYTNITVPLEMHGTAYFYVYTDFYDQVYEHVGRYNNVTRSGAVNIILSPPADLIPQNITADNTVSTGATFNFSYRVKNQGAGAPNYPTWSDRCYLSTNPNSITDAVQIANDWHNNGLSVGESYSVSHTITLPSEIAQGTYYLFVQADAMDNVFEYNLEDNNLLRFTQPITVVQPDLQIPILNVADTLHAGAEASVFYQLANTGDGAVVNRNVIDRFYLSRYSNGSNATQLPQFISNIWLNAHDSTTKYQNVMLPANLQDGIYYLFARTNINNVVNEANTDNNQSPIKQVYINHQLLPDLVITSVTAPDTLTAGASTTFTATIANRGERPIALDNLNFLLSAAATPDDILCTTENVSTESQSLAVGDSTTVTMTIRISPAVNNPASFTLTVNPNHTIIESSYSNNGYAFNHAVQPYPFDLVVTDLITPDQTISGEYIPVTWTVQNQGTVPMLSLPMYMLINLQVVGMQTSILNQPWDDRIYLSSDTLLDANDVQIGNYSRYQTLLAGDSYTANLSCRIPVSADGNYYVLVVSDATNVTFDSQRANNVAASPIAVTQSALPDLQVDTLEVSPTLTTGVSYQIRYMVSNRGEHITHGNRWTDAIYINDQPSLQGAQQLSHKIHNGQLDTNASYTDSISVTIPNTLIGDGYLIGYTDATDQIFEMNSDSNNMFILPVSVARPLPCDLTVLPPDFPQSANVGENVQISWTLQNIGLNVAQGDIKDAVYLSIDSTWSNDDIMLGSVQYAVSLAANGPEQRSVTFPLQGVPTGDYYVVVRTNILNALNENSYTNNKAVSLMTMHVDYPSLYIDQEKQVQLNSGQSVYYKLDVGPEYEHQTLSCKLTAPTPNVSNRLYIAYSSAPSASNFDWSATMPYVQEQEILIPSLNQGTYYIMAKGQTANNAAQSVTLLATIVDFEIISVNANSGTNAGSVTTQIIGAKFDTIMDFRLANSNGYLPAEKVFFHNSTESYATFNLRDQETGVYDMVAELPGGIITVKGQAFVVEAGVPAELLTNIIAPASVRKGNTFTVTIEYGNNGSTDLDVSGFLLVSTNGFPIAFSSDSLVNNATELTFETAEPNGNPDVIRPGHFASKTIFVKATHVGNINLKLYPIRRQY